MQVNKGKQSCQNCVHCEHDAVFGLICVYKASIEGIEGIKNFYIPSEVNKCNYYKYDSPTKISEETEIESTIAE